MVLSDSTQEYFDSHFCGKNKNLCCLCIVVMLSMCVRLCSMVEMKSSCRVCCVDSWKCLQGQKVMTIDHTEATLTPHRDTGCVCMCAMMGPDHVKPFSSIALCIIS